MLLTNAELEALAGHLDRAAREVGRIRRRVYADPQLGRFTFAFDRLADHVEWALLMLEPSAAQLVAWTFPGDDETADAAVEQVWKRGDAIRRLLGAEVEG